MGFVLDNVVEVTITVDGSFSIWSPFNKTRLRNFCGVLFISHNRLMKPILNIITTKWTSVLYQIKYLIVDIFILKDFPMNGYETNRK